MVDDRYIYTCTEIMMMIYGGGGARGSMEAAL